MQLRLGRDGLWYRFARSADGWDLAAGPPDDPVLLVTPASTG